MDKEPTEKTLHFNRFSALLHEHHICRRWISKTWTVKGVDRRRRPCAGFLAPGPPICPQLTPCECHSNDNYDAVL